MAETATIQMCGICENETACFEYQWDWGEKGFCGQTGKFLLEQKSKTLKRHISFSQLSNLPPAPMTRDERVQLKAQVYALEEEIKDLQSRGQKLYSDLELARADARVVMSRDESQRVELEKLKAYNSQLEAELTEAKADLLVLNERFQTLQRLVPQQTLDSSINEVST